MSELCPSCGRGQRTDFHGRCVFCDTQISEPLQASSLPVSGSDKPPRNRKLRFGLAVLVIGAGTLITIPVAGAVRTNDSGEINTLRSAPTLSPDWRGWAAAQIVASEQGRQPEQKQEQSRKDRRKQQGQTKKPKRWLEDASFDAPRGDRDIRKVKLTSRKRGFTATFILGEKPAGHATYYIDLYHSGGKTRLEALRKESGYIDMDTYDPSRSPAFQSNDAVSHRTAGRRVILFWPRELVTSGWNGRWSAEINSSGGGDSTKVAVYRKPRR